MQGKAEREARLSERHGRRARCAAERARGEGRNAIPWRAGQHGALPIDLTPLPPSVATWPAGPIELQHCLLPRLARGRCSLHPPSLT